MGRHRVPDTPRLQFRQPHDKLTAFGPSSVYVLVDRPFVGPLHRSQRGPIHIGMANVCCRVGGVRGKREEKKHGRLVGLDTGKLDLLHPFSDVQHVFLCQPVIGTVNPYGSFTPHVDHTDFPPLRKIVCGHFFLRCKQLHRSCRGNNAADDRAIRIAIDHCESPVRKELFNDKRFAQFLCR